MKYVAFIGILLLFLTTGFGQANRTLQFIKSPEGRNLLVLNEDSVSIDTLLDTFHNLLIDYFIQSENKIAIILQSDVHYWYEQFIKSDTYQFWTTDSTAQWTRPGWMECVKNPNNPDLRASYSLQDFHTVIKTIDDTHKVMNLQAQKIENAQPPMHERELGYVIQTLSEDSIKDWRTIDSVFRNYVVLTPSIILREMAFMLMILHKQFLEKADQATLTYYAGEIEKMEYQYGLRFYIMFIKRMKEYWSTDQTAQYARNLHEKNTQYWEAKFGNLYWENREEELMDLKMLMQKK